MITALKDSNEKLQRAREVLDSFEFDDVNSPLSFSKRLAREQHGWSHQFALRCIEEYKRFVVLMVVCDRPVTPSDEVDQVWHLHLLYSRSYAAMCEQLGSGFLHHGPTKGGMKENVRFDEQYEYTLAAYRSIFQTVPPEDIWPEADIRFGPGALGVWVRRRDVVVIERKMLMRIGTLLLGGSLVLLSALVLGGCQVAETADQNAGSTGMTGWIILAVVVGVVALLLILIASRGSSRRRRRGERDGGFFVDLGDGFADLFDGSGCGGGGSGCGSSGCGGGGCGGGD